MKKKFDCVEMKHKSARKLIEKTSGFSRKEELEYWQKSTGKLKNTKDALKKQTHKDDQGIKEGAVVSSAR